MVELSEREMNLRREVEPYLAKAYDIHMTRGGERIGGNLPVETGTLFPLGILNLQAGLDEEAGLTPELVERVRGSYRDHLKKYAEQGVDLGPVIAKALHVNKATEDNISWYHAKILMGTKTSETYSNYWLPRWTAEESFHSELLDAWGSQSGALDLRASHRTKVTQIMTGIHVDTNIFPEIAAYTDPQEGSTDDGHENTGALADSVGRFSMKIIGGQELRHQRFARRFLDATVKADPEYTLPIVAKVWSRFNMPGKEGIEDYDNLALQMAVHGIFTIAMVRKQQRESAEALGLLNIDVKSDEAKKAQQKIAKIIDMDSRLNRLPQSTTDRATDKYIADVKAAGRVPIILGRTVVLEKTKSGSEAGGELIVYPDAA